MEMSESRRWISAGTKLCAVIGNPVGHSLSPAIHNAAFEATGLDYVYVAFRVEDVHAALAGMRALEEFRGMSVTIPHKVSVMQELDEVEPVAHRAGAVNTVTRESGRLVGTSTDGPAAVMALEKAGTRIDGKRVAVLGSGGAARAVAFSLLCDRAPSSMTVLGVVEEELSGLVSDLRSAASVPVDGMRMEKKELSSAIGDCDILVHCTPVGMAPGEDESLVDPELLRAGLIVFDIVYTPLETRLLKDARAAGCSTVSGVDMFVNQAVLQFERWTGRQAPVDVMREVVLKRLQQGRP